jgi:hypothetical protein
MEEKELFRKIAVKTLGLVALSGKKLKSFVKDLHIEDDEVSQEGNKILEEIKALYEKNKQEILTKGDELKKSAQDAVFPSLTKQLETLKERIEHLEHKISAQTDAEPKEKKSKKSGKENS